MAIISSTVVLGDAKAATLNGSLSLTPASQSTAVGGSNVSYVVSLNPGSNSVNAVQVDLIFDPAVVRLVSITQVAPFFPATSPDIAAANISGILHNAAFMASGAGVASTQGVATLVFSPQGGGSNSAINFDADADAMDNGATVIQTKTGATVTVTAPDVTDPTTIGLNFSNGISNSLTITGATITASDDTGVVAWMIKETVDGVTPPTAPLAGDAGWMTSGITGTTSATIDGGVVASTTGTRYFWAYVKDAAGNVSASNVSAVDFVMIDMIVPTVSISSPAHGSVTGNSTPTLTYVVSDGTVVVEFGSASGSLSVQAGFSSGGSLGTLSDGQYTARVTATDAAGNVSVPAVSTFTIDATTPTFTSNDSVSVTAVDADIINYTINDATVTTQFYGFSADAVCNSSDTITTPFTSGVNFIINADHVDYLCLKAIDAAGNVGYSLVGQLNINSAPIISNILPVGSLSVGTVATTVSFNTSEAGICRYATSSGVAFDSMTNIIDSALSSTHSFAVAGLANGNNYTYYVRCQDAALMANSTDQVISFSVASPVIAPPVVNSDDGHSSKKKSTPSRSISNSKKNVKIGQVITQRGKKFAKNNFALLYFAKAGGGYYAPQKIKTSSSGAFAVTYRVNKPKGKYGWYAVDVKTGKKSRTIYYTVK